MWPAGHIHAAINKKKTIATPMVLSPNVLMGEATISLKVNIEFESPEAKAGSKTSGAPNSSSSKSENQNGPRGRNASKPKLTDEDREKYSDLQKQSDELAKRQQELFERADRGELPMAEAQAEADRLEKKRAELEAPMESIRKGTDPSQFDSDGYLRPPPASEPEPSSTGREERPSNGNPATTPDTPSSAQKPNQDIPYGPGHPDWERDASGRADPVFTDGDIFREGLFYPIKPAKWAWKVVKRIAKKIWKKIQKREDSDEESE